MKGLETEICEVFCVFVDARGFTRFCDTAHNEEVRKVFLEIRNIVLDAFKYKFDALKTSWRLRGREVTPYVKNLGDGFMIVYPLSIPEREHETGDENLTPFSEVCKGILDFIIKGACDINRPETLEKIKPISGFGVGVTQGTCLRLFESTEQVESIDFFGDIVNLAARLQNCARPMGIVVDARAPDLDEKVIRRYGLKLQTINVPGYHPMSVYVSNTVGGDGYPLYNAPILYNAPMLTKTRDELLRGYKKYAGSRTPEPILRYRFADGEILEVPTALIIANVGDLHLDVNDISCKVVSNLERPLRPRDPKPLVTIWEEAVYYRRKEHPADYDGVVLRLENYSLQAKDGRCSLELSVRPSRYFWAYGTNFSMDFVSPTLRESIRSLYQNRGNYYLSSLGESELGNHIGINIIVLSEDGKFVFPRRTRLVANERHKLSPTGSGTVGRQDFNTNVKADQELKGVLTHAVLRELAFETTVELRPQNVQFLGACRELLRGGLPDFFFIGHCDVPSSEICQKLKDKVPLEYREAWQADFGLDISGCYNIDQAGRILVNASRKKLMREKLKNYIQNHINELSPALETALVLFGAYVGVITIECKPLNKEDNRCFA